MCRVRIWSDRPVLFQGRRWQHDHRQRAPDTLKCFSRSWTYRCVNLAFSTGMWFQQDRTAAHTIHISTEVLRGMFPERVISRYGDLHRPPRSPDFTASDFSLWGYLKSKVNDTRPVVTRIFETIIQEVTPVPIEMIHYIAMAM